MRWLETTLWLVGACFLSLYALGKIDGLTYQAREWRKLDQTVAAARSSAGESSTVRTSASGPGVVRNDRVRPKILTLPADAPEAGATPTTTHASVDPPLGKIEIPSVGVSAIIKTGEDEATLRVAVGHIPGTGTPGGRGNVALAAHRDGLFRGLRDIRLGDEIRITTPRGDYKYVVQKTSIVKPSDVWVLDDIGEPVLTLVTCYPFNYVGSAPKRFIVRAFPLNVPEPSRMASAGDSGAPPPPSSGSGRAQPLQGTSGSTTPTGSSRPEAPPTPAASVPAQTANAAAAALPGRSGGGPEQKSVVTQGPGTPTAEDAAGEDAMAAAAFSQKKPPPQRVRKTRGTPATPTVRRERDEKGDSGLKKGLKKMFSPFGKLFGAGKKKDKDNDKDKDKS